ALFAWLEDEVDGAVEAAGAREIARSAEQHGRVPIVTAAVHAALEPRRVGKVVLLVHRQRIHVRAQADRAAAVVALPANHGDHAGPAHAAVILDPEPIELRGHDLRSPMLLEAELRVRVQIAPQLGQCGVLAAKIVDRAHGTLRLAVNAPGPGARCAGAGRPRNRAG